MKKVLLIFIIFISFFYLASENAYAEGDGLCGTDRCIGFNPLDNLKNCGACSRCSISALGYSACTADATCADTSLVYWSGCTPFMDGRCNINGYSNPYNCAPLSCGSSGTPSASVTKYCDKCMTACGSGPCAAAADTRTDTQCQDMVCAPYGWVDSNFYNGGWQVQNKPDGTTCTYNGLSSTCLKGICHRLQCACDNGATPCAPDPASCSRDNPGKRCVNVGGTGVLQDDKTCTDCKKYNVNTGIDTGGGLHKNIPEICLDSYDSHTGKYTNYKVDEYAGSGTQIKETYCDSNNKCAQKDPPEICSSSDTFSRIDVSKSNIVNILKNIPAIPTGTNTFYCDSGGLSGTNSGGGPPTPSCNNNGITDNGETGKDCGGGGCPTCDTCAPGNPPYQLDGTPNCAKCGCPPSQYQPGMYASLCSPTGEVYSTGSQIACNSGTGTCSYSSPPGATGEIPDCP